MSVTFGRVRAQEERRLPGRVAAAAHVDLARVGGRHSVHNAPFLAHQLSSRLVARASRVWLVHGSVPVLEAPLHGQLGGDCAKISGCGSDR
jgi:hypothetical protein